MFACELSKTEIFYVSDAAASDFRESLRLFAFLAPLFVFLTLFCPSRKQL